MNVGEDSVKVRERPQTAGPGNDVIIEPNNCDIG